VNGEGVRVPEGLLPSAIAEWPIPTAPISVSSADEAFGLHLLTLAMRMPHIRRVTESLSLVDATNMERRMGIDLDLTEIDRDTKKALARTHNGTDTRIWVPLERHSRGALSSVVVRDQAGVVVPRLTGREASHAIGAGLARLFRMLVSTHPDLADPSSSLYLSATTRQRSLWLCEAAILGLAERGELPDMEPPSHVVPTGRNTAAGDVRALALKVAASIAPVGSAFAQLLDVAASEYVLVAAVRGDLDALYVEYEAPLLPAVSKKRFAGLMSASWFPLASSEFTLQYDLLVPRGVDSYHLNLQVAPEIIVRRFVLSGASDEPAVNQIVRDIESAAADLAANPEEKSKIQELELQSIAGRIAEIGRRRVADSHYYRQYLRRCFAELQGPGPFLRRHPTASVSVDSENGFKYLSKRSNPIARIASFSDAYENGRLGKLADYTTARDLLAVRDTLQKLEYRYDVSPDNDPRENGAHAQWRRRSFGREASDAEPVRLRLSASLADDAPSLSASVMRLLTSLLGLVALFFVLLHSWVIVRIEELAPISRVTTSLNQPFSAADAIVTVLLVVPGLLIARLDFPSHLTVLGRLRLLPRYLAYAGVGVTYVLAVTIAAMPASSTLTSFVYAIAALLLLLTISLSEAVVRVWRRRVNALRLSGVPTWLRRDLRRVPYIARRPHVRFSTVKGSET
jgi:hypothetical protein